MTRVLALVTSVCVAALQCHAASAQTLDALTINYDQLPYVWMHGTANAWFPDPTNVTTTIQAHAISIALCNRSAFSVQTEWEYAVHLNLPATAIYEISVYRQCDGAEAHLIGRLTGWVEGGLDPLFASNFE